MSDSFCSSCGEYILYKAENHQCPPVWEVFIEDYDEDEGRKVMAWDEEEAAEKAVEQWDAESAEYACVGGDEIKVTVKGNGELKKFIVTGEGVPRYHAIEVA
jgi:hypothetical protein